jgi:hypothetical protein
MLIPKNVQCRILAALLGERLPDGFTLEQIGHMYRAFSEPWRTYLGPLLDAMEMPPGIARSSFIAGYVRLSAEERQIVAEEAARSTHIPSLEELDLPEIEWVWEHWLPRGMVTVLGAMPSAGKSYLALDLAARIMAGTTFPDGTRVARPGPVIYVDAENLPQIHNQRATAWGVDRSQLYVMGPADQRLMIDLGHPYDQDRLVEWAWAKRPALIVVDSLGAVTSRGENHVEDVRDIFIFLNRVALDFDCGVLLIHHLRKPVLHLPVPRSLTFYDLRGSSHIAAMGRSIIGLHWVQTGPRADLNDPRRMEVLKTNLCPYPEGMGVSFRSMPRDPQVAEVVYGEPPQPYREPSQRSGCAEWLLEVLAEYGPLPPAQVVAWAEKAGYSRKAVYHVRRELAGRVANTHGRQHPENQWTLASEGEPVEGSHAKETDIQDDHGDLAAS